MGHEIERTRDRLPGRSAVLRQAGALTGAGLAIGLICAVGASRLMRSLLFGVEPWDGLILAAVAAVLGIAAIVAAFVPARRAVSVGPIEALRAE